jgi:dienelactone hydrolase
MLSGSAVRAALLALLLATLTSVHTLASATEPATAKADLAFPDETIDQWNGHVRHRFRFDGREAWVVEPATPLPGNPWSWCMMFPDAFVQRCAAPQLVAAGFHHAFIDVGNTFGSPAAVARLDAFHDELVRRGLAPRAALIGLSRGGLSAHRYATEHPEKVAVIYDDAAVCDFKSWPGGKGKGGGRGLGKGSPPDWAACLEAYGFADEAAALAYDGNPVDTLPTLAAAGIALVQVVGDADDVVPPAENADLVIDRYRKLGGTIEVFRKPDCGHHPHGLDDPRPVVEFIVSHAGRPGSLGVARTPQADSAAAWRARVPDIRRRMEQVMGPLPGPADPRRRSPPVFETLSEERGDGYVRRKIRYRVDDGDLVPAWLLVPDAAGPAKKSAAMLCLHQTNNVGKDEPAGLGGLPGLHYAHELAARGYVCLVPDYPRFGEYRWDADLASTGYASGSMKAVWNNIRGVDLLASLPLVDPDRIGVIGHSLGGHNAIFTAAFDERLKAVVTSCGFTPFPDYYRGDLTGWTSRTYMPRIRDIYGGDPRRVPFDFPEVVASLAPRGFFANSPVNDDNFAVAGVRRTFAEVAPIYGLFAARDRLVLATPDAPHEFPQREREQAYSWLDRTLAPAASAPRTTDAP